MHPRLHAESNGAAAALFVSTSGETITFAELEARANRAARLFRQYGCGIGDTVALMCDNRPEFMDVYWAAQRAGLILVPLSTRLKPEEVAYILQDSRASLLLVSGLLAEVARGVAALSPTLPGLKTILTIDAVAGFAEWREGLDRQQPTPINDENIGGRMIYSSGTTGRPKGIRYAPAQGSPIQPNPSAQLFGPRYQLGSDTVYLGPGPLYHASPLGFASAVQALGGAMVLMPKFEPEPFLAAVERYRVTVVQMVPTMFIRLLALPEEARSRYDLSSLRAVIHAAAPCPIPVKRAMIDWLGPIIDEFYSGTEGAGHTAINSQEWLERPGSVGRPLVGEIHVCDEDGRELPAGAIGTIYFGAGRHFHYHNDPGKTAASRHQQHSDWSTLGDLGHVDEGGYLFLSDRKDFMIISGGVNIYPQEAENLLQTHPAVADVAVFGVPNPDFGEEVKAVVQPADWSRAGPELERELIAWCRNQLADIKCPRSIDFDRELPRAETGKLYKKELKARYWPAA